MLGLGVLVHCIDHALSVRPADLRGKLVTDAERGSGRLGVDIAGPSNAIASTR